MTTNKKKTLVLLLALLAIGGSAGAIFIASPRHVSLHGIEHRPKVSQAHSMATKITEGLHLSPSQRADVEKVVNGVQDQMDLLNHNEKLTLEEKQRKAGEIFGEAKTKIDTYLTAEQRARFDEMVVRVHTEGHRPG